MMIRRAIILACFLAGIIPALAASPARMQAAQSRTPAAAPAAVSQRSQDAIGTWASTEISLLQYRNSITILTSADGGATWDSQFASGGDRSTSLYGVSCASEHACVAVGDHGMILQLRAR